MNAQACLKSIAPFAAALFISVAGPAHSDETADAEAAQDSPRAVIKFADLGGIKDWRATDRKTLYVEGRNNQWFKITLFSSCSGLRFAETIGFVTEANGDLDKFSSVLVKGRRCTFKSFEAVDGPPKKNKAELNVEEGP